MIIWDIKLYSHIIQISTEFRYKWSIYKYGAQRPFYFSDSSARQYLNHRIYFKSNIDNYLIKKGQRGVNRGSQESQNRQMLFARIE